VCKRHRSSVPTPTEAEVIEVRARGGRSGDRRRTSARTAPLTGAAGLPGKVRPPLSNPLLTLIRAWGAAVTDPHHSRLLVGAHRGTSARLELNGQTLGKHRYLRQQLPSPESAPAFRPLPACVGKAPPHTDHVAAAGASRRRRVQTFGAGILAGSARGNCVAVGTGTTPRERRTRHGAAPGAWAPYRTGHRTVPGTGDRLPPARDKTDVAGRV
jgi:hypothetical protein